MRAFRTGRRQTSAAATARGLGGTAFAHPARGRSGHGLTGPRVEVALILRPGAVPSRGVPPRRRFRRERVPMGRRALWGWRIAATVLVVAAAVGCYGSLADPRAGWWYVVNSDTLNIP